MTRPAPAVARAAALALCAVVAVLCPLDVLGTEAGGGSLTGLLARMCLGGGAAFALGAVLAFLRRPVAIWAGVVAAALSVPLYLGLLAPARVARLSSLPSSIVVPGGLVFNGQAMLGLASIVLAGLVFGATSERKG